MLLNAIAEFLGKIKNDIDLTFLNYHEWIKSKEDAIKESERVVLNIFMQRQH